MTLEDLIETVLASEAGDWSSIERGMFYSNHFEIPTNSHFHLFNLRTNIDIAIAYGGERDRDFEEDWHKSFPDPKASLTAVDLVWRGAPVHREFGVSVDGGRSFLPLPRHDPLEVPEREVRFFEVVNTLTGGERSGRVGGVRDYLKHANIKISNRDWPRNYRP